MKGVRRQGWPARANVVVSLVNPSEKRLAASVDVAKETRGSGVPLFLILQALGVFNA